MKTTEKLEKEEVRRKKGKTIIYIFFNRRKVNKNWNIRILMKKKSKDLYKRFLNRTKCFKIRTKKGNEDEKKLKVS